MVGSSTSEAERESLSRRLKVGFVLVVAASGALVALQVGGRPVLVAGAAGLGAAVGGALVWYLSVIGTQALSGGSGGRRR